MEENRLNALIDASAQTILSLKSLRNEILQVCLCVVSSLRAGNKVLTAGNGGSAAEAMHMSEELVGRFRSDRVSLPAISLVADSTALTCIGNDYGYDKVFSRQVEGLGAKGDVLVIFSSSGKGDVLMNAARAASAKGVLCVGLLGRDGGALLSACDFAIVVPGTATERIQEAHQLLLHIILDAVEDAFAKH